MSGSRTRARGRVALLVGSLAAVCAAGCSVLVSTTDLSSGGVLGDGSTTSTEASTGESGTTSDAEAGADVASKPFCASLSPQPKLCADFDTGTLADVGAPAGMLTLDTALSTSPPRSLACEVPSGAKARGAYVQKDFVDTPSAYTFAFDVQVDAYDTTHDVELVTVRLRTSATDDCVTDISIRSNLWTLDESCETSAGQTYGTSHESTVSVQLARWVHFDVSVSIAPQRTYSVSIDGAPAFTNAPLDAQFKAGLPKLQIGITYTQLAAVSAAKVHIDNVVFDYR